MKTAKTILIGSLLSGSSAMLCAQAHAATLSISQGDVLVSRGAGFERVAGTIELRKGDSVMAKPKAVATIAFGDGCSISLKEQAVFIVGDVSPCKAHQAGNGASGATADPTPPVSSVVPYVIGAGVIGGAIAIATSGGGSSGGSTPSNSTGGGGTGGGGGKPGSP